MKATYKGPLKQNAEKGSQGILAVVPTALEADNRPVCDAEVGLQERRDFLLGQTRVEERFTRHALMHDGGSDDRVAVISHRELGRMCFGGEMGNHEGRWCMLK